jgi:hypothetical protein
LRQILEKLPTEETISLYFVVPERHYETFPFQKYLTKDGHVSQQVPKSVKNVQQWVLEVPDKMLLSNPDAGKATPSEVLVKKRVLNEEGMQQPRN